MATSADKFSSGYAGKKKARKKAPTKEVAGPYRSQSSNPAVRSKATSHEHRKVAVRKEPSHAFDVPKLTDPPTKRVRKLRKAKRLERKALHELQKSLHKSAPPNPQLEYLAAKQGKFPSAELQHDFPRAYDKAFKEAAKHEGLKEDPAAEFVISTAATAGLGAGAKAVGTAAEKALLARAGEQLGSTGATIAESAAEKGAKALAKKVAKKAKEAPAKKVARIKETPKRVRTAPARAKKAATTKEGRKAAAKTAAKHPVRTGYGAAAVSPVPLPGELDKRARAFAEGTAAATLGHPKQTLETTIHGGLGFLTAPLAVGGAAVESAKQGSPAPLGSELKTLGQGTIDMTKKLASGDPKTVEQTTLHETGLVPFIPVPHIARRVKGSSLYEDSIRGKVRDTVERKRSGTRAKRIDAEQKALESGEFVPKRRAKKIRQSIPDSKRKGEKYVLRRTGKLVEKQRSRHYVAREVSRMQNAGELSAKASSNKVAKILRKSKGTNQKAQNYGDALRIFVKHGLPKDQRSGLSFVQMLHDNWPKIEHGDVPAGFHLDRHSTMFILDHPEIFHDKHFWQAVEEFDRQAKPIGTSGRNQFLAQVDNIINPVLKREGKLPILKPEEMVPSKTAAIMKRLVPKRTDRWSRAEVLNYAKDLEGVQGSFKPKAEAIRKEILQSLVDEQGNPLMRPPEHGGAEKGISTTRASAYTSEMEREFVKQAQEHGRPMGLRDPAAYVADKVPSGLRGEEKLPDFAKGLPIRKVWPSRGLAAKSGNAASDFESLVYHSLEAPRNRAAMVEGVSRIFDKASRKVMGRRYLTRKQVEQAINSHQVPDGTVFVRTQALTALLERGKHNVSPEQFLEEVKAELEHGQKLISGEQLAGEVTAAKGLKGDKFAPMDAVAVGELLRHMEPLNPVSRGMGHATNFVTRSILNSPAFEAAQFAQEGVPMAMALGKDVVNVPKAIAAVKQISKLDPESQAMVRSVVGSSVGVLGAPSLKALRSEGFMDPIRAAGSKQAWRHAWELVNGDKLTSFDRTRAGLMREGAAIARIEGDFRRAKRGFHLWRSHARNLFKDMEGAVEAMKGMNASERAIYVASHPKLADRLTKEMTGMAGNWNSFTVFERNIAPFAIFYPFQRYAVLWALYHFPLDHPVVATGLTMMGQVNAQELQKIAAKEGAEPDVLDYTKPVVNGKTVLPAGQRFFPALGAIQQAALEHKPTQALGTLSPALTIPIEALTGKNAYTNQPLDENGWLYAARQFANLSPFMRFMGAPDVGAGKSPASEAFGALDPLRAQRSLFDPYIGQTAEQFGKEKKLGKEFETKYGEGDIPGPFDSKLVQELLYGGKNGGANPKLLPKVLKAIHESERASDFVKKAEAPYLGKEKPFTEKQKELLQQVEDAWKTGPHGEPQEENPFGLPSTSASDLRKQFGLPSTSAADLRKQFGIGG